MKNQTLVKLGLGAILSMAIILGYYGCGGSSSSNDSGSSAVYEALGITDTDFGTLGVVTTTIGTSDVIRKTALQSDGKILAGGYTYDGTKSNFGLARYTITGALDTTFSTDGIVTTTIGANASLRDLALQTDGKIVAGGGSVNNFALARYTITGALDTTFDTDGIVTTTIGANAEITGIALQTDGKIVAGGTSDGNIALARYTITGALDDTFGISGVVTATIGTANYTANKLIIQSDGKIVIGSTSQIGGLYCFALSRYTAVGAPDTAFGSSGVVTATFSSSDYLYTVALQPDGKILMGGYAYDGISDYYSVLIRYTTAGALDSAFGGGDGVVTTTAPTYDDIEVYDIALQSNGKIVAAFYGGGSTSTDFMLARYNTNGTLDTSFGGGDGMVMQHLGDYGESMTLAIQTNGYIVLGGYANYSSANRFALMRFK